MKYATEFDVVLFNDNLEQTKKEASEIVNKFLKNP
jgi:guanylate kinase